MNNCFIDHIVITAPTLESGAEFVEKTIGVVPQKGGEHPKMGTHNLLLGLGESVFLEVIACNPVAAKPPRPRWFALDDIKADTPAKLKTWVVRTKNIHATLAACSESIGEIEPMSRGKNSWLITISKDGKLPISEGAPSIMQWQTDTHPSKNLFDYGLSLTKLQIYSPETDRLTKLLNSINLKYEVEISESRKTKIIASIDTPRGIRLLSV